MPFVSRTPFVGPAVWIGLSLSLLERGETGAALGLFYGARGWIDTLIRRPVVSA